MNKLFYEFQPERNFGGFSDRDEVLLFYSRIQSLITPQMIVVDVGCGRGHFLEGQISYTRELHTLKQKCKLLIGLDVDPIGEKNQSIDEFKLIFPDVPWPLEENFVDMVISDYVLEHISRPDFFFSECHRVLKPGGYLFIRTSNMMSYLGLFITLIPEKFHESLLKYLQPNRKDEDKFPTAYKCNTVWKIRSMLRKCGFIGHVYGHSDTPTYLAFSKSSFMIGLIYDKLMPHFLKNHLFVLARKRTQLER